MYINTKRLIHYYSKSLTDWKNSTSLPGMPSVPVPCCCSPPPLRLLQHRGGQERVVTDEMPGDPMMSIATQEHNVALDYDNSSSSARWSHFFSVRKSCASGQPEPRGSSETPRHSGGAARGSGHGWQASLLRPGQQHSAPQGAGVASHGPVRCSSGPSTVPLSSG